MILRSVGAGQNNPDSLPSASSFVASKDYPTESLGIWPADAYGSESDPYGSVAKLSFGASYGYGGTPGWRCQPDPMTGTGTYEDSVGWSMPNPLASGSNNIVTISFMFKMTSALANAIPTGEFWVHVNKAIDLGGDAWPRYGIHFGDAQSGSSEGPQWTISGGGAGPYFDTEYDWRQHGDQWVWVCAVIDGRGATSADRYIALYIKPEGAPDVIRIGRTYESEGLPDLSGEIPGTVFTPLWGFWDDMENRELLTDLASMFVYVDRLRIGNGWPTGFDGPPF